jgi:hypothetical protein
MHDFALQAAGVLAILIAIVHGAIAEFRVFPTAQIEPRSMRRLLRMVWQASTVAWICLGTLLIAASTFGPEPARRWIVALAAVALGYGAIGNMVVTRGRHFGGWLMAGAVALALIGF